MNIFVYQTKIEAEAQKGSEGADESLPIIDLALGAKIISSTEELAKEMLDILVKTLPEEDGKIKAAYEAKDFDQLQFVVHKLHGGTSYCGVPRLKAAAKRLEEVLKGKLIDQIDQNYVALLTEISNVLTEHEKV